MSHCATIEVFKEFAMPRRRLLHPWKRCTPPLVMGVGIFLLMGFAATGVAVGQSVVQTAIERRGLPSPEERAEAYLQLQRQAEALQKQAAVNKLVAKLTRPTVVHIEADVTRRVSLQLGRGQHVEEAGSGVIVELAEKYYVLTNRHVVRGASHSGIKINLADGRQIHPRRVWTDKGTDIAVMEVSAPNLVAARMGDSDRMEIGDFVLAVGSPFGLSRSLTFGIISAKGRRDLELGDADVKFQDFIQTDAAINPGNSGGPLINLRGEVVGINTAIASNSGGSEGIGFAIPINMFMVVARQLIEQGKVSRAFLGVNMEPKFGPAMAAEAGLPRPIGARINRVTPDSPAEAAKLQVGDVILQFDEVLVEDDNHLINLVSLTEVGKAVVLVIYRNRTPIKVSVVVGDRDDFKPSS